MDSMRSLNSSLPRASPHARRKQTHGELLQAFKAAALSVTQLYKTAAAEDDSTQEAHNAGYINALDDLLAFLDERNLGLGDGEGWQVREWATQRHQSMLNDTTSAETNDPSPAEEDTQQGRSVSPAMTHKNPPQYQSTAVQTEPAPEHTIDASVETATTSQKPAGSDMFHFQGSTTPTPQSDVSMQNAPQRSPPSVRVELHPRSTRNSAHRANHHSRTSDRMPTVSLGNLGHGAGSKRKAALHEFFDVTGEGGGGGREGPGSGKRGRMT